jgi:Protein of unknown function (DUF2946)
MLSQKLFRWVNKIALFAIVFASLAPSISHALVAQQGAGINPSTFAQEVCTTSGTKITIQVLTTKGKQLATELPAQSTENNVSQDKEPVGIQHHLQHCPFCANPSTDAAIQAPHAPIIAILEAQAQRIAVNHQEVLPHFSVLPPPAQAPPRLI